MKIKKNNIVYPKKKSIPVPYVNVKEDVYVSGEGKKSKPSPPETRIAKVFKDHKVTFIREASFKGFGHPYSPYRFDFYLPDYNIIIEYDGSHHSQSKIRFNDKLKNQFCRKNKIKIVRFNKIHYHTLEVYIKRLCKNLHKLT